jgi:nitrogen regulatory protein PII
MEVHTRKLLTIMTEAILEGDITKDLERLGAMGYTITDARGKGARGVRSAGWEATSNIRIEVICRPDTAMAIADRLKERYYQDYAMSIYVTDVGVMRPEKY